MQRAAVRVRWDSVSGGASMSKSMIQKSFTAVSVLGLIACIVFSLYAYNRQLFTSRQHYRPI